MPSGSPPLQLNILDQCPIPEGSGAGDALRNSIELARRADRLGYGRYWLAEHHGTPGLACNSPEVMIGPVAAATSRIRVGSGGVMLPHYSPLKVAESFSMLSALFPGRIDLGIGRAPGTSSRVAFALQRDRRQPSPDDFRQQMDELLTYFCHEESHGINHGPLRQLAELRFQSPEVSLLGSSPQSAVWAAELGLPYVFADFINPAGAATAAYYREHFRPAPGRGALAEPKVSVAVWALCAETDEEALRISASARMMLLLLFRGRLVPVPAVEKALAFLAQEGVPLDSLPAGRRIITGTPEHVSQSIESVAAEYGADEVFMVNIVHDPAARLHCYELIAEVFRLRD
jgi:luciferase family oxidoreductase group 1